MGGSEKGSGWQLGAIVNKIEIINPRISLINYIDNPPNPTSNKLLAIADSGANIHPEKQATPTMAPVITENDMKARLPDGITMESTHIATLQLPGISKQARQIHILLKMQTSPLISLGFLCDDGFTITLDKQEMSIKKNGEEIIKGTRKKKTGTWEVNLGTQQSENIVHNILAQTSKLELAQYLHAGLFSPTAASLLKAIKQGFLKTWPGLTKKTHQETPWKIKEYNDGKPEHEKTRATTNERKTSW